ncbi:MAG: Nif3-like dinuclear metal center hexameric protein [Gemmatimonadaceae bacterium]
MADLGAIVRYLDEELRTTEVPDSDLALNGLQLANSGGVSRIAAAVDFSLDTVTAALSERAQLLLVHHGMFWRQQRLVGAAHERLRLAFANDLAVYSSHIPLDLHPSLGNNCLLAKALRLTADGTFGRYKGLEIGVMGSCDLPTATLLERVREFSARFATAAVSTPFEGGRNTRRWAIITGAGASSDTLGEALDRGVDTLIVGEGAHHTAVQAMEDRTVVIYAGHYATETLGVRALAETVSKRFDVPWSFVNVPTGL